MPWRYRKCKWLFSNYIFINWILKMQLCAYKKILLFDIMYSHLNLLSTIFLKNYDTNFTGSVSQMGETMEITWNPDALSRLMRRRGCLSQLIVAVRVLLKLLHSEVCSLLSKNGYLTRKLTVKFRKIPRCPDVISHKQLTGKHNHCHLNANAVQLIQLLF